MSEATFNEVKFTDADVINPDDYIPQGEYNPHNVRPWLLHDHGFVLAVVFADCEQDAIDEAVDKGKLDRYQLDATDALTRADYMQPVDYSAFPHVNNDGQTVQMDWTGSVSFLGNASEPFDIESLSMMELPNPPFSFCALFSANAK